MTGSLSFKRYHTLIKFRPAKFAEANLATVAVGPITPPCSSLSVRVTNSSLRK